MSDASTQCDGLAQIKARLEAATPGPWQVDGMDSGHSLYEMDWWVTAGEYNDTVCDMGGLVRAGNEGAAKDDGGKDAIFIAHAPEDMAKLIAAVESVLEMASAPGDVVGWRGEPNDLANFACSIKSTITEALA